VPFRQLKQISGVRVKKRSRNGKSEGAKSCGKGIGMSLASKRAR
jgi:hypothetical protein